MPLDLFTHLKVLDRKVCLLQKQLANLLLVQVNYDKTKVQSVLNFVDSNTVEFTAGNGGEIFANIVGNAQGFDGLLFEYADNYASISATIDPRLIFVVVDETNANDKSLYLHTGVSLQFLQTIK